MGLKIEKYVTTQLCIVSCLYLSNIMVGYCLGWNAVIVPKLMDPNETPLSDTISLLDASWLGSSPFIGLIIGSPITSHLATVIGRKKCLFIASSLLLIANLMLTFATSFRVIIIGRIINGLGVSIADALNMVYIGEIASSNIRGILLSLTGVFLSLGNLLIFSSGPFVSYAVVGYIILPFCFVVLIGYCFLPESPLYYVIKGDEEEAKKILRKLGRDKDIENELSRLSKLVEEQKNDKNCNALFAIKSNRNALVITSVLYFIQESNGMIYILYYVITIFATAASSVDPRLATVLIGLTNTCTVAMVPIFIERAGRRILLLFSTAGCFLCTASLGIYFYLSIAREDIAALIPWLPLTALILMCISFNLGLGVIPNTIMGEMFRPDVRSIGSSISLTVCWITALAFVGLHGYLTEIVGSYLVFAMSAVINAVGFVFVVTVVPETMGMTLSQIEMLMSGK